MEAIRTDERPGHLVHSKRPVPNSGQPPRRAATATRSTISLRDDENQN